MMIESQVEDDINICCFFVKFLKIIVCFLENYQNLQTNQYWVQIWVHYKDWKYDTFIDGLT